MLSIFEHTNSASDSLTVKEAVENSAKVCWVYVGLWHHTLLVQNFSVEISMSLLSRWLRHDSTHPLLVHDHTSEHRPPKIPQTSRWESLCSS